MTISAKRLFELHLDSIAPDKLERMEREFFSSIRVQGGVNKTTWSGRLFEVEEAIETALSESGMTPTSCLDVGASSAISTLDWWRNLKRNGHGCRMVALDRSFRGYLVDLAPGMRVLADSEGKILQYDVAGYGFRPSPFRPRDRYSGVFLLGMLLEYWYDRYRVRRWPTARGPRIPNSPEPGLNSREVWLVSPLARREPAISFYEWDVFAPVPPDLRGGFDLVRVANLFNLEYFDEARIRLGLQRVRQYLKPEGGILAVSRTWEDGSNHGTIFYSDGGRLAPVRRKGSGSEVEHLAVGL